MDIMLVQSSVYGIPSKDRVGAIVHDGTLDMQVWPGPGTDRELERRFGGDLQQILDRELRANHGGMLSKFDVARIASGKLHCDFLAWVGTRDPEPGSERAKAPSAKDIEIATTKALEFVAKRDVSKVAFGALGDGADSLDVSVRLAHIVHAASAYYEYCLASKTRSVIEEVWVCDPMRTNVHAAKRDVGRLATLVGAPAPKKTRPEPKRRRSRSSTAGAKKQVRAKTRQVPFTQEELEAGRVQAISYSMKKNFSKGEWVLHPTFGIGRVETVFDGGTFEIAFESGTTKRLAHQR